jgi:Tol biopolymer transport system component
MRLQANLCALILSLLASSAATAQVAELQVPTSVTLAVGQREEVLPSAYSSAGDFISDVSFRWSGGDSAVVRVETSPVMSDMFYLVGVGPGTTTLRLQAGGKTATIAVTVTGGAVAVGEGVATILQVEPPDLQLFPFEERQLDVRFLKDDGSLAGYSPLTWESNRPSVASVDGGGLVTAMTAGVVVVEARTESGLRDRVRVEVVEANWAFDQPRYSLAPLESDTIHIVVPSQDNRRLDPRQFDRWRSLNPNIVTVTPVGVVTAASAGATEIVASGYGREQRVSVTVHPEIRYIDVKPNPESGELMVPLGGSLTFVANALDAREDPIPDAVLLWEVADTTVAAFDAESLMLSGREIGTTTLTMRSRGFADFVWQIRVAASGLVLSPDRIGTGLGDRDTLVASFVDSLGIPLSVARAVTWTSFNPSVAAISSDGVIDPRAFGRVLIEASTPWGVADTAIVFVQGEILVTSTRSGSAALYAFDRSNPGVLQQITDGPGNDMAGSFSPDGSQIAFASSRSGNFDVYVAGADGSNPRSVASSPGQEAEPVWSADGSQILYQSDVTGSMQVWIVNADGTGARALTTGEPSLEPAASPDGRRIAFSSTRDGTYDVYVMELGTGAIENLTRTGTAMHERVPAWLDDETVVYVREARDGRNISWSVVRHELSGDRVSLTDGSQVVSDFAIAPDGTLALAVSEQLKSGGTLRRLYLLDPEGRESVLVPPLNDQDQMARPAFRR